MLHKQNITNVGPPPNDQPPEEDLVIRLSTQAEAAQGTGGRQFPSRKMEALTSLKVHPRQDLETMR